MKLKRGVPRHAFGVTRRLGFTALAAAAIRPLGPLRRPPS
jgi:hypothetical protein